MIEQVRSVSQCQFAELSWSLGSPSSQFHILPPFDAAVMARSGLGPFRKLNCSLIVSSERQRQKNTGLRAGAGKSWQGKDLERRSCIHEECKRIIFQAGGFIFFSILGFHFLLQSPLLSTRTCATSSKVISAASNLRRGKLQLQLPPNWEQCKFREKVLYFQDGTAGVGAHLALRQWEPILIIKRTQWLGKEQQQGNFKFCFWGGLCILADAE